MDPDISHLPIPATPLPRSGKAKIIMISVTTLPASADRMVTSLSAAKGADLVAVLVCHDSIKHELSRSRKIIEAAMRNKRIIFFEE